MKLDDCSLDNISASVATMNCVAQILIGIIESVDWQTLGIKINIKILFCLLSDVKCVGAQKWNRLYHKFVILIHNLKINSDGKWTHGK